jgi:uncharacterized membrane protein
MKPTARSIRLLAVLAAVLGYSLLAHYTLQSKQNAAIGALVAIAPILLTCIVFTLQSKQRIYLLGALILVSPLFWLAWKFLVAHYDWVYWLVHESLQCVLLITFARTLRSNQQPLCTQFAKVVHGSLTPELAEYTRKITIAWTLFFVFVILISSYLFFSSTMEIWSTFANLFYLPLVALMFIAEFIVRKYALPDLERTNIMDAVHAFFDRSRD